MSSFIKRKKQKTSSSPLKIEIIFLPNEILKIIYDKLNSYEQISFGISCKLFYKIHQSFYSLFTKKYIHYSTQSQIIKLKDYQYARIESGYYDCNYDIQETKHLQSLHLYGEMNININLMSFDSLNEVILNESCLVIPDLEFLFLYAKRVTRFSHLNSLSISNNFVNNQQIVIGENEKTRSFFENLEYLELFSPYSYIISFIKFPKLKFLKCHVGSIYVCWTGEKMNEKFPILETLIIHKGWMRIWLKIDAKKICELPKLKYLSIIHSNEDHKEWNNSPSFLNVDFGNFYKLKKLEIDNCFPTDMPSENNIDCLILKANISIHEKQIFHLKNLEKFDFRFNPNISDLGIKHFSKLKVLKINKRITEECLKNFPHLEELDISESKDFDISLDLKYLQRLKKLTIGNVLFRNYVGNIKYLIELIIFESSNIYPNALEELIQLPKIAYIQHFEDSKYVSKIKKTYEKDYERYSRNHKIHLVNKMCSEKDYFKTLFEKTFL